MYHIKNASTTLEVLPSGDIKKLTVANIMVNQLIGTSIESMASNIYLRFKAPGAITYHPLMGRYAQEFAVNDHMVAYRGQVQGVAYTLQLQVQDAAWFYTINLTNNLSSTLTVDLVYTQDMGLASEGHVGNNEAYNSQYIDHKAFKTNQGYVVCSRQNQGQMGGFPYLQQGCLNGAVAFSVDGFPLFGLGYKTTNQVADLLSPTLNNRLYQYDFAYTALQSQDITLAPGATHSTTFYGLLKADLPTAITAPLPAPVLEPSPRAEDFVAPVFNKDINLGNTLSSTPFTQGQINKMYPARINEEFEGDALLSFFTPTGEHVVLMEKENHVERSHGHIITTLADIPKDIITSTSYIYGVLESHIAIGNTSFNKLNTNCRNGLNVSKASGRRLMVKQNGQYQLLTMPGVYEMGFNYAKWLYQIGDDVLEIVSFISIQGETLQLQVASAQGKAYEFMLYDVLNPGIVASIQGQSVEAKYPAQSMPGEHYPNLAFKMTINQPSTINQLADGLLTFELAPCPGFVMTTSPTLTGEFNQTLLDFETEKASYRNKLSAGLLDFNLHLPSAPQAMAKFNHIALWYSHNARVHYASPHGLEQYTGAAWGTRDVCQGPFEYFLVAQNYQTCRYILQTVYRHQYIQNGNWPQWFMFDNYRHIQHHDSHGDIIVWPLKALADYLNATGDYDILQAEIPYTNIEGYQFTTETEPLIGHVKRQIDAIKADFIPGTALSCYGGGDWDDTLQPAKQELAKNMVSGWTVSLTYQAFNAFAKAIADYDTAYSQDLQSLCQQIKTDYNQHLVKDDVATGFLLFTEDAPEYLLHPRDNKTGINYRLLPMIRGMISEMFTPDQAEKHYGLIKAHLYHPDGVRLMNTTCTYRGGENRYFMRAETAAAFAREVCLHYVHAHIRFIEAMAKIGQETEAWQALEKVNPIALTEAVPNALRRQSNVYFTSSEAAFENRYDAMENFHKIKTGEIGVKGGWRLYSSGPGIYLHQLIAHVLGLSIQKDQVVLDPVLPIALDGLTFTYGILGKKVTIQYHITGAKAVSKVVVDDTEVAITPQHETYRFGGVMFNSAHIQDGSTIHVYK